MLTLIYVIYAIVCVFLVVTVLLQPGKSGGLGAAFGGGGNTVFGASGGTPVFRRMTTGAAICFMLLSLLLAYLSLDKSVTNNEAQQKRGLDFSVDDDDLAGASDNALQMPGIKTPDQQADPANAAPAVPAPVNAAPADPAPANAAPADPAPVNAAPADQPISDPVNP